MKLKPQHLRTHYTDYPFVELGDTDGSEAPIRPCQVVGYDGDKYATILVGGQTIELKAGYVYTRPGRCGEVPRVSRTTRRRLTSNDLRRWKRRIYGKNVTK